MRYKDIGIKYEDHMRKQVRALEEFVQWGKDVAECLVFECKKQNMEIPDNEYRAIAYFINDEYKIKEGSLFLLWKAKEIMDDELPTSTPETFISLQRYRFRVYSMVLTEGGF